MRRILVLLSLVQSLIAATVWQGGSGGYNTYRIPALLVTAKGTLLAFCEGRLNGRGDSGAIRVILKRSFDNGGHWSDASLVAGFGDDTVGNPAPVLDRRTGAIWLLLTRNAGSDTESQILARTAKSTRTVWVTHSEDDGATWAAPKEITRDVKPEAWTWYATGPGSGIQLRDGRMVIACDHNTGESDGWFSHVIFSDDDGRTWKLGGSAGPDGNESTVAELPDGRLALNMRSAARLQRRSVAFSRDRGATWTKAQAIDELVDPVCEGSLIRVGKGRSSVLLFANPASQKREALTVRMSRDGGLTWPVSRLIHAGPAAYSNLAELRDGSIGILYEAGEKNSYETITFERLEKQWWTKASR